MIGSNYAVLLFTTNRPRWLASGEIHTYRRWKLTTSANKKQQDNCHTLSTTMDMVEAKMVKHHLSKNSAYFIKLWGLQPFICYNYWSSPSFQKNISWNTLGLPAQQLRRYLAQRRFLREGWLNQIVGQFRASPESSATSGSDANHADLSQI